MAAKGKLAQKLRAISEKVTYRQLLILAGVVSCLLGLFVFMLMPGGNKKNEQPAAPPVSTTKVVVAKQDIPQRAIIKDTMLQVVDVPDNLVPAGALKDMSEALNLPASVMIQQGDVLTDKKVYKDIKMAGFPGMIPPDCRAISVPISDVTGIAGFAKPGDYVDIMIVNGQRSQNRIEGEILMQNVLLLGVNKSANPPSNQVAAPQEEGKDKKDDKKKENSNNGNVQASGEAMATATLAVTPEEALKLAVAMEQGKIYLVLRPAKPKDMFVLDTDYFQMKERERVEQPASQAPQTVVINPNASASAPVPSSVASAPPAHTIEVYRGTDASTVGVDN